LPNDLQGFHTERTTARPFVVALRTYLENKLRAAHEFVIFSKRSQKSAFRVFADQEFFQAENPLTGRQSSYGENRRE
jgi:hypothetical protein